MCRFDPSDQSRARLLAALFEVRDRNACLSFLFESKPVGFGARQFDQLGLRVDAELPERRLQVVAHRSRTDPEVPRNRRDSTSLEELKDDLLLSLRER